MGWMFCGEDEHGREIGYGVEAECDEDGCEAQIDRGLSYVCGSMHMDSETCHGYFCSDHQAIMIRGGQLCRMCFAYDMMYRWDEPCRGRHCFGCSVCVQERYARKAARKAART